MTLMYLGNFNLSIWGFLNALTIGITPLLVREVKKKLGLPVEEEFKETNMTTIS